MLLLLGPPWHSRLGLSKVTTYRPVQFFGATSVGLLQQHHSPDSIPVLRQAIRLKPALAYLDYDDYGAYYKKCLWALQAIGTPDAIAVIRECAASEDAALREQAKYRLDRIDESLRFSPK